MTISLKHNKVATTPDDGTSEVGTDEWNHEHDLTCASGVVLGRKTASTGPVEELSGPDVVAMLGISPTARSIFHKIAVWYDMDETSGTALVDAHAEALNGTYNSATLNQTGIASGIGTSVELNAVGDYAEVANNALLRPMLNMACMAWVKRNGAQANFAKILWKPVTKASGTATFLLQQDNFNNGGKAVFRVTNANSGGNVDAVTTAALADLTTYCLIGNRVNDQTQIWNNGVMEGTNAIPYFAAVGTDTLRIGSSDGTDGLVGNYGQVAIFRDALTPSEIAYLYNGGDGVSYATLKAAAGYAP